jgi:large repetitive protein
MNKIQLLSMALFTACAEAPKEISDPLTEDGEVLADSDADGYLSDEDCDDNDPTINPGAEELCDGFDNNCDNQADEDVTETYYVDSDSDGFGNEEITTEACEAPAGFVSNGSDCDDTDASSYPSAEEVCDGFDNNCDGEVDEGIDLLYYEDADQDGFGDDAFPVEACELADGLATIGGDCDDADSSVNPSGEEICNDKDDDCDGETDEGVSEVFYADLDEDGYGDEENVLEACELPDDYVQNTFDCDDNDTLINPAADEFCDGVDNDCDGETDEGVTAVYYADSDGDGYGDLESVQEACSLPIGHVDSADDCDDGDASANPAGIEVCDGVDNNCDGEADESEAVDSFTWYEDDDDDGFGSIENSVEACAQPDEYVSDATDCDDNDNDIFPGAPELCNGEDDNCDEDIDEDGTSDGDVWFLDGDGDGYGDGEQSLTTCTQPIGHVEDGSDCDDNDDDISPAAAEVCNGEDDDCDGEVDAASTDAPDWFPDTDGDGYGVAEGSVQGCDALDGYVSNTDDCDDADASISPASEEVCDGSDNDCDGDVDELGGEDLAVWYIDADGDGFGDVAGSAIGCSAPEGYVSSYDDCDDSSDAAFPGADELCNGVDDNCDGAVDEALMQVYYLDGDGDGFGEVEELEACEQPEGYAAVSGDCDDGASAAYPEAEEICNGVDDDCDGSVDEALLQVFYLDADGDGFGETEEQDACEQPEGYAAVSGDCDDDASTTYPEAEEVCNGVDDDCDGSVDEALLQTFYLDADGDGFGETEEQDACEQPEGYAAVSGDCDDDASTSYPEAEEVCNGIDDDCDGSVDEALLQTFYLDADGDGFGETELEACEKPDGYADAGGDCDDSTDTVSPALAEVCNGIDDDCSGEADDGDDLVFSMYYSDGDADGYGAPEDGVSACLQPSDHVSDSTDCDDNDDDIYPGATELCNEEDDDCDEEVDEADSLDAETWYADADGDGFGDLAAVSAACSQPEGAVADNTDCDDGLDGFDVNPAAIEYCDSIDNNCDEAVDEGSAEDALLWYLDDDDDGYGDGDVSVSACLQPDGYIEDGTDCDDGEADSYPGNPEFCDGLDNDCNEETDEGLSFVDWYLDSDDDGFGAADESVNACEAPAGYVSDSTDCDDSDPERSPDLGCADDCQGIYDLGYTDDGVYVIDPDGYETGHDPMQVYCDMTTDGGGWTLCASLTKGYVPSHMIYDEDSYAFQARLNDDNDFAYELDAPSYHEDSWDNSETLNYGQFCRLMGSDVSESRFEAKLYNYLDNVATGFRGKDYDGLYSGVYNGNLFLQWFTNSSDGRSFDRISGDQLYIQTDSNGYGGPYTAPSIGLDSTSLNSYPYTQSTNPWDSVDLNSTCIGCTSNGGGYSAMQYGQTTILNDMSHSFWDGIPNIPYGWSDCTNNGNCNYHESGYGVWLFYVR